MGCTQDAPCFLTSRLARSRFAIAPAASIATRATARWCRAIRGATRDGAFYFLLLARPVLDRNVEAHANDYGDAEHRPGIRQIAETDEAQDGLHDNFGVEQRGEDARLCGVERKDEKPMRASSYRAHLQSSDDLQRTHEGSPHEGRDKGEAHCATYALVCKQHERRWRVW